MKNFPGVGNKIKLSHGQFLTGLISGSSCTEQPGMR